MNLRQSIAPEEGRITADCGVKLPKENQKALRTAPVVRLSKPHFAIMPTFAPKVQTEAFISHDPHSEESAISHGIELFNSRRFFDAHEAWEAVWLKAREPDKKFLQGLIQISAAFHHLSRNNHKGLESLLRAGLLKIEHAPPNHRGMNFAAIRSAAGDWLAAIEAGADLNPRELPKITRVK
jgi:uncharacterized protein